MSDWFVESANHTCGSFPADVDEMAAAGLTPVPSVHVTPPRVQESAISMECKVRLILQEHTQGTEELLQEPNQIAASGGGSFGDFKRSLQGVWHARPRLH